MKRLNFSDLVADGPEGLYLQTHTREDRAVAESVLFQKGQVLGKMTVSLEGITSDAQYGQETEAFHMANLQKLEMYSRLVKEPDGLTAFPDLQISVEGMLSWGLNQSALTAAQKCRKHFSRLPEYWRLRSDILMRMGKFGAAFKTLQQARKCGPGSSLTLVMMAECLLEMLHRSTAGLSAVSAEKLTGTLQACLQRAESVEPALGMYTEKVWRAIEKGDYAGAETQLKFLVQQVRK